MINLLIMIAILYGLLWARHTYAHYSHLINKELRLRGEDAQRHAFSDGAGLPTQSR